MNIGDFRKVLDIVSKYSGEDSYLSAEHDMIFLPIIKLSKVSVEDKKKLKNLGAEYESGYDRWIVYV